MRYELTEPTRLAVNAYMVAAGKKSGDFLFVGRRGRTAA